MGLIEKLQSKLELYRLEQKYARRKNRTNYTTGAQYVDGEYVYTSPDASSPTMSTNSTGGSNASAHKRKPVLWAPPEQRR